MKILAIPFLSGLILITGLPFSDSSLPERNFKFPIKSSPVNIVAADTKLQQKATDAKKFIQTNMLNNDVCFFIDMSIPSGKKRFFIYDLRKDSVFNSALVAHGNCFEFWLEGRRYSNVVGSGCTSLGKYKVGEPYTGRFGYSYKLHGLDSSNSNAYERTVVLHQFSDVPENEVEDDICQSNGCPMVAPKFMEQLKQIIGRSKKPLLLWIYD